MRKMFALVVIIALITILGSGCSKKRPTSFEPNITSGSESIINESNSSTSEEISSNIVSHEELNSQTALQTNPIESSSTSFSYNSINIGDPVKGGYANMTELISFELHPDNFINFISNPSNKLLRNYTIDNGFAKYSKTSTGMIKREEINGSSKVTQEYPEGVLRIASPSRIPICNSLIKFAGSKSEIDNFLKKNGINGSIQNMATVYATLSPVTIWVNLDVGDYFITIDEYDKDLDNWVRGDYVYRVYNKDEFCQKYALKNYKLVVNGNDITSQSNLKTYGNTPILPFLKIMKQLGATTQMDINNSILTMSYKGENYNFNLNLLSIFDFEKEIGVKILYPGSTVYFNYEDDEIMIDSSSIKEILKNFNIKVDVDFENLIVTVN